RREIADGTASSSTVTREEGMPGVGEAPDPIAVVLSFLSEEQDFPESGTPPESSSASPAVPALPVEEVGWFPGKVLASIPAFLAAGAFLIRERRRRQQGPAPGKE